MIEDQRETEVAGGMSIGQRLALILEHYGTNSNRLSSEIELSTNTILTRIIRNPERGMSLEVIQKILFKYPGVNPDWFVTGRGEMIRDYLGQPRPEVCPDCIRKDAEIKDLTVKLLECKDTVIRLHEQGSRIS
jgi:hypothetical protein